MSIADELARLEDDLAVILPSQGNVRRYALQRDGSGGRTESWIADVGNINVRKGALKPAQVANIGERLLDRSDDIHITYPKSTRLNIKDRLLIGSDSYEVQSIIDVGDFSFLNQCWTVYVDQPYTAIVNNSSTIQPVHALPESSFDFFHPDILQVEPGRGHRRIPGTWRVLYVAVSANQAPGTGPTVFDVVVNGVTIFTTTANRPALAAGQTDFVSQPPDIWQLNDGDDMRVDVVSIADSLNPGSDVTVQVVVVPLLT